MIEEITLDALKHLLASDNACKFIDNSCSLNNLVARIISDNEDSEQNDITPTTILNRFGQMYLNTPSSKRGVAGREMMNMWMDFCQPNGRNYSIQFNRSQVESF